MARLIKEDGTESQLTPKGKSFEFRGELYDILETDIIEHITLANGDHMLFDEEAKRRSPPKAINQKATKLLARAGGLPGDCIRGSVVICNNKEMGE